MKNPCLLLLLLSSCVNGLYDGAAPPGGGMFVLSGSGSGFGSGPTVSHRRSGFAGGVPPDPGSPIGII